MNRKKTNTSRINRFKHINRLEEKHSIKVKSQTLIRHQKVDAFITVYIYLRDEIRKVEFIVENTMNGDEHHVA